MGITANNRSAYLVSIRRTFLRGSYLHIVSAT